MSSIDGVGGLPGAVRGLRWQWRWMFTISAFVLLACAACLALWALRDSWPSRAERRFDAVLAGQATDAAPVGPHDFVEDDARHLLTRSMRETALAAGVHSALARCDRERTAP